MTHTNKKPIDIAMITTKPAASGNLSYGTPVVLHDTSRKKVTLVPFYVRRSQGTDLSIKLISYRKSKLGWLLNEDQTLSLNEGAARKLHAALADHLTVADTDKDGDYILIRMADGAANLGNAEPATIAHAMLTVLNRPEIASHLSGLELTSELVDAFQGAIRLREMRQAVAELRRNLDEAVVTEQVYQKWCEAHSWAFGTRFLSPDDVRSIAAGDNVDLLMPALMTGLRDVVELKRPDMPVIRYDKSHKNHYWSSDVSKTIGQVHRYLDVLAEEAAKGLRDHPGIVAYAPRAIIVIGRSHDWCEVQQRALHGLNSRLHGISVMTYDHLLAQAERLVELLGVEIEGETATDEDKFWE